MPEHPPKPLKSAAWLLQHLQDPHLRVLDCRYHLMQPHAGQQAYAEGHIPNAIHADLTRHLSSPVQPGGAGGRHPLPLPDTLAAWLGQQGISNADLVVCYDDPNGAQGMYAARAWWLLRWLGHQQTFVLDGGWPAYLAAGGHPSTEPPHHPPTTFTAQVQTDMLATAQDVQNRAPNVLLIDSRAPERYRGEVEPLDQKAGHIPGAINRNWTGVLDEQGHWRDPSAQAHHFNAGNAPTITYCGSGVSATPNILARTLTGVPLGPNNQLYAGSWSDWISDPNRPTAQGQEP